MGEKTGAGSIRSLPINSPRQTATIDEPLTTTLGSFSTAAAAHAETCLLAGTSMKRLYARVTNRLDSTIEFRKVAGLDVLSAAYLGGLGEDDQHLALRHWVLRYECKQTNGDERFGNSEGFESQVDEGSDWLTCGDLLSGQRN